MGIVCSSTTIPIGERCRPENQFAQMVSMFLCKPNFQFDTYSDFATESAWDTELVAENLIPIHGIKEVEDTSTDDLVYQSGTGEKSKNGDGIPGFIARVKYDLNTHQILRSYSGGNWGIIIVDRNKNVLATSPDGTVVKGFQTQYFEVSRQKMAIGGDQPAFTEIEVQYADAQQWDTNGVFLNSPAFLPTQKKGVGRVTIEQVGSIDTNAYVIDVKYVDDAQLDGSNSGAETEYAISGAVDANFQSKDAVGDTVAITGTTEDSTVPGRYTVSHSAFTAGTAKFLASTALKFASTELTLS